MPQRFVYRIHGLHCADEIRSLRQALEPIDGVRAVSFDLIAEQMWVDVEASVVTDSAIRAVVRGLGMRAEPWHDDVSEAGAAEWARRSAQASGALLVAAVIAQAIASGDPAHALLEHGHADDMPAYVIGLFVAAALAGVFTIVPRFWRSLKARRLDMHVLVVVSIAGAAALGEWSEGATVASLFSVASLLESWSVSRARREVAGLMRTAPRHAHVVSNGRESCVPAAHVAPGTVIVVRPGERIPADGVVRAGRSTVADAHGDHVHHHARGPGDRVVAGGRIGDGELEIEVSARPAESAVARMVEVLERSRSRRAVAEHWVEQFALYYTPIVMALAGVVAIVPPALFGGAWHDWIYRGLMVTLIACPCALVISTPVTIVAAQASAARVGVLVKGGELLETAARTTHVAVEPVLAERLRAASGRASETTLVRLGVETVVLGGVPCDTATEQLDTPDAQIDLLTTLRRRGMQVMAVGDGRHDSGVLSAASVSLVMGAHGTESAIETADIVSVSDDPRMVPWLITHARRALQVVKQNVALAIGAKVLFLVAAGLGSATLWMAVAADTGATIAVTFNALRMLRAVPAAPTTERP